MWAEAERLCGMCYHRRDHVAEINEYIRECTTGKLLAIVDRDPRRRASMDEQGYLWRLWKQFASVPELYKMRDDLSPEQVAEYRHGMAVDFCPRRLWKNNGMPVPLRMPTRPTRASASRAVIGHAVRHTVTQEKLYQAPGMRRSRGCQKLEDAYGYSTGRASRRKQTRSYSGIRVRCHRRWKRKYGTYGQVAYNRVCADVVPSLTKYNLQKQTQQRSSRWWTENVACKKSATPLTSSRHKVLPHACCTSSLKATVSYCMKARRPREHMRRHRLRKYGKHSSISRTTDSFYSESTWWKGTTALRWATRPRHRLRLSTLTLTVVGCTRTVRRPGVSENTGQACAHHVSSKGSYTWMIACWRARRCVPEMHV